MDILVLLEEKKFLSREFLLWLWFMVDSNKDIFHVPNLGDIIVSIDGRIVLESVNREVVERIACKGDHLYLKEARTGLKEGKVVEECGYVITVRDNEYRLYLKATHFNLQSLVTPKIDTSQMESDDIDGIYYEKLFMLEEINHALDGLFLIFLKFRLNKEKWNIIAKDISGWISRG